MQNLMLEISYKFKKSYGGTPELQTTQDAPWLRGPSLKTSFIESARRGPHRNVVKLKSDKIHLSVFLYLPMVQYSSTTADWIVQLMVQLYCNVICTVRDRLFRLNKKKLFINRS